jgi:hypothetical protein
MSQQIFKTKAPLSLLVEFLDGACERDGNARVLSKRAYRAAALRGEVNALCTRAACHYQASRRYYVERPMTYPRFVTVIRQLCRLHGLECSSSILYSGAQYEISYRVSLPPQHPSSDTTTQC